MTDLRQTAQQALERLEACVCPPSVHHDIINPLRAALKQQDEPIGWLDGNDKLAEFMHRDLKAEHDKRGSATPKDFTIPVYTTQPQRKPLTDEMRKQMKDASDSMEMRGAFANGWLSAEAAHGIKEGT